MTKFNNVGISEQHNISREKYTLYYERQESWSK